MSADQKEDCQKCQNRDRRKWKPKPLTTGTQRTRREIGDRRKWKPKPLNHRDTEEHRGRLGMEGAWIGRSKIGDRRLEDREISFLQTLVFSAEIKQIPRFHLGTPQLPW